MKGRRNKFFLFSDRQSIADTGGQTCSRHSALDSESAPVPRAARAEWHSVKLAI